MAKKRYDRSQVHGAQNPLRIGETMGGGVGVRVGRGSSPKKVKKEVETSQDLLDKAYIKKFGPPPKAPPPPPPPPKAPPKVKSKKDEFYLKKRKENPDAGPTHMKPSATKKVNKKVKKEDSPTPPVSKDMSFKQKAVYGTGVVGVTVLGMTATEKAQDANKGKPKSDFITMVRTAIDSSKRDAVKTTGIKRPELKAFKEAKFIKAPNPPKSLVPGVKAASGDGPGPTPKSSMRESQIRDFKKYNKSNLLGRSIDDALRGFFSFMGTLPKSTDEDKWKNKK